VTPVDDAPTMTTPGRRQPLAWILAALVALPALAAAVMAASRTGAPVSDWALIELRLRDVGSADTPLLGPFSRYGWNHPGPLMFWLLAPLYRVFGATPGAMDAAAAVLTGAVAAGLVVVARRVGGRQLAVLVALAGCLLLGAAGATVADPWNPWLAVMPFAVFLVAAAGVAGGDLVLVPVAVGTGSFLVQTHVGYVALVGAMGAWAAVWLVSGLARQRRGGAAPVDRRQLVTVAGASALIALVAWSGPIVEQATHDPGNVRAIASYFTSSDQPTAGWPEAGTVVGRELHPIPPWLGGPEPTNRFTAALEPTSPLWALPTVLGLAVATLVAWRRRDRRPLHLAGVTWIGLATGTLAVTRITGDVYFYLVRFWWVLGMFAWVSTAWVAWRVLRDRFATNDSAVADAHTLNVTGGDGVAGPGTRRSPDRALAVAALVVVVLASVGALLRTTADPPVDPTEVAMATLGDDVVASLEPGATYRVESTGFSWFEVLFGVVNRLDRDGIRTMADGEFVHQFGERRVAGGPGVPDVVAGTLIVAVGDAVADAEADSRLDRLAVYDPLAPPDRARLNDLKARLTAQVRAAGRDDLVGSVANGGLVYILTAEPSLASRLGIAIDDATDLSDLVVRDARVAVFLDRSATLAGGNTTSPGPGVEQGSGS
jgi:hypothetical protein